MAKKEQLNDGLFDDISMDDMEDQLLTVDVGPDDVIEKVAAEVAGGGDPGKPEAEKTQEEIDSENELEKNKSKEKKSKEEEDKSFIVDSSEDKDKDSEQQQQQKDKDKSKDGGTPETNRDSPVYLHAAALQENGVLPNFDLKELDELKPEEAFLKINEHIQTQIDESIQEGVDEYKVGVGEKALEIIDALEKGVPFEHVAENYSLEQQFGGITDAVLEGDIELQKAVYSNYLSMKGFTSTKITKLVEKAVEDEEILSESKDSIVEIRKDIKTERSDMLSQAKTRKVDADKKNLETRDKIKSSVKAIKEIIPGIAVTEAEKKELIKMMTVPVRYQELKNGQKRAISASMELRSKNIIAYETRLNYLISKGFFDTDLKNLKLETIMKKQETTAAKKFIDKITGEQSAGGGTPPVVKDEEKEEAFSFPQGF